MDCVKDDLHIYVRVSSDQQFEDGYGLDNQKELGLQIAKRKGMNPVLHDEGSKSGTKEDIATRPVLVNLMKEVEDGNVKHLWCFNQDRLSRNEQVSVLIKHKFRENKVTLYVGEGSEFNLDNPSDRLMFGLLQSFAEYDQAIREDRFRRGRLSTVRKGRWHGGPPPFGYDLDDGRLKENKRQSYWVKKIYDLYAKGETIYSIRNTLQKSGVLTNRNNVRWNENSILKILTNTHYEGHYTYKDRNLDEAVLVECEGFLSPSVVKSVRERLNARKRTSNYQKHVTLLKEFLVCGHCGSKFGQRIMKRQSHNHYFCRGNTERLRSIEGQDGLVCVPKTGRTRAVRIEDCDELVWNTVVDTLQSSHIFKESFKSELLGDKVTYKLSMDEKRRIERKIRKVDDEIRLSKEDRGHLIVNKRLKGDELDTVLKLYDDKIREMKVDRQRLSDQLKENEDTRVWVDWTSEFKDRIDDLKTGEMSVDERKRFLDGVIQQIDVTTVDKQTHQLSIVFKAPYVGDGFEWNMVKGKKSGYTLNDGKSTTVINLKDFDRRFQKKNIKNNKLGYDSHSSPLRWSSFRIKYNGRRLSLYFNVIVTTKKLSIVKITDDRLWRLNGMKMLFDSGWTTNEIRDLFNGLNIRSPRGKRYTTKLIWVSLKKFNKRLDRMKETTTDVVEERLIVDR